MRQATLDGLPPVRPPRIRSIGIELEGAWLPDRWEVRNGALESDGSLRSLPDGHCVGEIQSPPLPLAGITEWAREHYPDRVNESCGLHVHMAVGNDYRYSCLMDRAYAAGLHASLKRFGVGLGIRNRALLDDRLDDLCRYCHTNPDDWKPDVQALATNRIDSRYWMINCCAALHGTIEIRVLPMFTTSSIAVQAINLVAQTTEHFLARSGKRLRLERCVTTS